ncbi:MAG: hypothetical protein J2P38_07275 [Candidatus Dormibacteraeota bacterium]|nr:hypothetical protein [Candidatus Dormibacteraeota bacterium]
MPSLATRLFPLLRELPAQGKLAYCLFRDRRVPVRSKAALVGVLGLLLGPIDLPEWVPFGQMEVLPLVVLAVRVFNDTAPREVVKEQRTALAERRSVFDSDLQTVIQAVRSGVEAARAALRRSEAGPLEARPDQKE